MVVLSGETLSYLVLDLLEKLWAYDDIKLYQLVASLKKNLRLHRTKSHLVLGIYVKLFPTSSTEIYK